MRRLAKELAHVFQKHMAVVKVPQAERTNYVKWLRYYLDFCAKYKHPPRDSDSLEPFLQKLASKNQGPQRQQQAAASIGLYYQIMQTWSSEQGADAGKEAKRKPWDKCYTRLKEEIRLRQYSPKTLQTYSTWIGQFQRFLDNKLPSELDSNDARCFLTHLAVKRRVTASTQNQAFNALLFLYRHILKTDYDLKDKVVRARKTKYIPVVLSREEVDSVIACLQHPYKLAVQLLYGCGLRLSECLKLRVHCFNFDEQILTVHDGKGKKDRTCHAS